MTVRLRSEVRASAKDAIAQVLPTLDVGSYIAMTFAFMTLDATLPKSGPVRDQLAQYFDGLPLAEFVNEVLSEELEHRDDFRFDSNRKLTDLDGYDDPAATAEGLLRQFETLPWSYRLTGLLPHQLHELLPSGRTAVQLAPNLHICRATPEFQATFSLATDNPSANDRLLGQGAFERPRLPAAQWTSDGLYFQIQTEGFIGRHPHSPAISTAEGLVRSFCGLGLAIDLFRSESYLFGHFNPIPVYVHRLSKDGKWIPFTRYNLSDSVARGLHSLHVGDANDMLRIKPLDMGQVTEQLERIKAGLSLGERADQTLLAARWLFDGSTGNDPLLTFVQAMVVLEILLGDKSATDAVGISTLISNRYAYMVGKTHDERAKHIATFKRIYAVRSQIVHSGKPRLRAEEHQLLRELLSMGRTVVSTELGMLLASSRK